MFITYMEIQDLNIKQSGRQPDFIWRALIINGSTHAVILFSNMKIIY